MSKREQSSGDEQSNEHDRNNDVFAAVAQIRNLSNVVSDLQLRLHNENVAAARTFRDLNERLLAVTRSHVALMNVCVKYFGNEVQDAEKALPNELPAKDGGDNYSNTSGGD